MKHLKIEKGKSASVHEPLMFQELSNGSERCSNDVKDDDYFFSTSDWCSVCESELHAQLIPIPKPKPSNIR